VNQVLINLVAEGYETLPNFISVTDLSLVDRLTYHTIRYDRRVDSKAESNQLNLAHVTKTNKRQCPLSSVQVRDPRRQSGRNQKTMAAP